MMLLAQTDFYYANRGMGGGFDGTYVLIILAFLISALVSAKMNATFSKYSKVRSYCGMTGAQAAQRILSSAGIYDVRIEHVSGKLTDHYDPSNKVLRLSDAVYGNTSIAAIGVAAHECGHAVQHFEGYAPLSIRGALVPVVNFGSMISWPLIIIGLFMNGQMSSFLIDIGILLFMVAVAFHLITLPVEINASRRAVKVLGNSGMLREDEVGGVKKVLRAAAMTYVASAAAMILQLLRLLILTNGRRRND